MHAINTGFKEFNLLWELNHIDYNQRWKES